MADFSDVLLTVDYDRTMTGPDSKVPERNLEAVRWFMEQGGAFTVNTGRSLNLARKLLDTVPMNAPMLLFNGGAAYENGEILYSHSIDLPVRETVLAFAGEFPELNVEVQNLDGHFLIDPQEDFEELYKRMGWQYTVAKPGAPMGTFMKFAVYGQVHTPALSDMFTATGQEVARFRQAADFINARWGDKLDLYLSAPRILDAQPKGIHKGVAARRLQQRLGRKILVCAGDADNDVAMLNEADYAFCPADSALAQDYPTVCPCGEGSVAEVICKKIPEILQIQP